ncbi:MAG: protein TolR [Methylobacter sp.]|jgi:biopolymer transport protein TolR|nr:protein TolR [Methylobacter sp.]MDP3330379.1 protein TolR [Methylococcaceae bacterium]MDP3903414.1 protein TolR [Methylococcaceae bacterium]PPD49053.1 MAG: protein TolR [Methylobacter sp.]
MSRKGHRRKPMAEINVVPYIDVTLVLLIIFMITTPMLQTGVEVELPQTQSATVESKDEPPIVVSIQQGGQYFLNVGDGNDESVQVEDIYPRVAATIASKPGTQVLINADKAVDYGTVVTVMAKLKNAGVPSVGLMTKSDE